MRILLVNHEFSATGAAIMLLHLATHLVRDKGWQVDLLDPEQEGILRQRFIDCGISIKVSVIIKEYDLAIVNTLINNHYVVKLAETIPTLFWVHEGESFLRYINKYDERVRISSIFSASHKIIFYHPFQQIIYNSYLFGLPTNKIAFIPAGIDLSHHRGGADHPPGERQLQVLFVGGLHPRKRPNDLIQAMVGMNPQQVHCTLVGDTNYLEQETTSLLANHRELFTLTGEVSPEQLQACYSRGDIFCQPSGDETFGIAIMEAALHGIPPILSDLPAYQGIWSHGVNCLIYPVGDLSLLRWFLNILLADEPLRKRLGEAARQTAKRHSLQAFFARFDGVIHEFI